VNQTLVDIGVMISVALPMPKWKDDDSRNMWTLQADEDSI